RDRVAARVHHTVEVQQRRVVRLGQGLSTALGPRPDAPAHSASLLVRRLSPDHPPCPPHPYDAGMNTAGPSEAKAHRGLDLSPVRGFRYAPDRGGGVAAVTSPPCDVVVRPEGGHHLQSADRDNIVRMRLRAADRPDARNAQAAETL